MYPPVLFIALFLVAESLITHPKVLCWERLHCTLIRSYFHPLAILLEFAFNQWIHRLRICHTLDYRHMTGLEVFSRRDLSDLGICFLKSTYLQSSVLWNLLPQINLSAKQSLMDSVNV